VSVPTEKFRIRRITVALRGQAAEARLLGSAARLARETAAELSGVFLEDIDLLHLAELPLAIEICRATSVRRRVEAADLVRQLASQAVTAEQALARVAEDAGVAWSFRVARGVLTALLTEAAAEADITLLPAIRHALWTYGEGAAAHAGRSGERRAPVAVVFDGSAAAVRALDVGLRLVAVEQRPLTVILSSPSWEAGERLREQAEQALGKQSVRFHMLVRPEIAQLLETVREQRTGILVVPVQEASLVTDTVHALQRHLLDCTTLLVR
jgi:hypothetical protein